MNMFIHLKLRRFHQNEDGLISTLLVVILPLILFVAGIAIDLTSLASEKRYVQAQADLAALSAIRHFDTAEMLRADARKTINANDRYPTLPTLDSQIQIGMANRSNFVAARDQQLVSGNNAVRVEVRAKAVMYILPLFINDRDAAVDRYAVAAQQPRVSFALSNCLLSANLLRPILQPLIGAQVDVLCSGRGIDTHISGQSFLQSLNTDASLLTPSGQEMTYGDILDANLPVTSVLGSALGVPIANSGDRIRLGDVIYLAPDLRAVRISQPLPALTLSASDIAFATAELLGKRVATVQAGLTLPSIGTVQANVTIGDPRKIILGAIPGDRNAIAKTSQIRVELPAIRIANLFNLTMGLEVANASAALTDEGATCSQDANTVVAVFNPVDASLLDVDLRVDILGLPLNLSGLGKVTDAVFSRVLTRVSFTRYEATFQPVKTFGPTITLDLNAMADGIENTIAAMLNSASLLIAGQSGTGSPCTNPFACVLNTSLSPIDLLLRTLVSQVSAAATNVLNATGVEGLLTHRIITDLLGLSVAQANLELLNAGCDGRARLVD
jgi:uncharacterized membrane protein